MGARKCWAVLAMGILVCALSLSAQQAKPKYSIEEYNDYTAAINEQDAQARLRALDAFIQKYPESALRPFVFQNYLQTYAGMKRWDKVVEYADKFLELNRSDVLAVYQQTPSVTEEQVNGVYYQALLSRAYAFLLSFDASLLTKASDEIKAALRNPETARATLAASEAGRKILPVYEGLLKAEQRARDGLKLLETLPKPAQVTEAQFAQAKLQQSAIFQSALGFAAFTQLDYDAAARAYAILVQQNPNDPVTNYRLGVSYLQAQQRQPVAGLWQLARAVALFPENQRKGVRDYLVQNAAAYTRVLPACLARDIDALLTHAQQSATPAPSWSVPNAEQVAAARNDLTVKRVFDELKAGGEQRQLIWLASCGMELPDLAGKVLEVKEATDNLVTLRLAVGEEAADTDSANVEAKVKEPPEAKNLKPGDIVRVSGVLTDYQPEPFLLMLTEVRVNPEDIPKVDTPAPRRRPRGSR